MMMGLGQSSNSSVWGGLLQWFNPPTIPTFTPTVAAGQAPKVPPSMNAQGIDYDPADANSVTNTIQSWQAAIGAQLNAQPCPFTTSEDGSGQCCAEGEALDSDGSCYSPVSTNWAIVAVLVVGGLVVFDLIERKN